jgi:cell division protein FtsI (penicillin-binding protein 3)
MLGRTDSRFRLLFLLVGFAVGAALLVTRLGYWQVLDRDRLAEEARQQTSLTIEVPSRRGEVYDRSGTVLLATSVDRYRLAASPDVVDIPRRVAMVDRIASILHLDDGGRQRLAEKLLSKESYVVLAREVDEATASILRSEMARGELPTVSLEPEPARVYPQAGGGPDSTLAAQLLGFVNRDGLGQYGVEAAYQEVLAGEPRTITAERDTNGNPIPDTTRVVDPGVPGRDLRLTIDSSLQVVVEQECLAAWVADGAKSVSAVILDPYTGEVYASATYPSYDANDYRAVAATPERFVDPVVSSVYEPGSVLKMLTAAAALESGKVSPKTLVNDSGTLRLDGGETKVSDADRHAMGWLTFEDVVAYSRNVGAARVALALGPDTRKASIALHDTWTAFGFGRPTGIDVAGEVAGIVRDPTITRWSQVDLANGSFGQGVAVTPIQLAVAFAAMVNGGSLVQPHVVAAIGDTDVSIGPRADGIVSRLTARQLVRMMRHVVTEVDFYRSRTLVPGYVVGGKTGTAQIWDPTARNGRGDWKQNVFNFSFVGFIGKTKPELIVAIRINEASPNVRRAGDLSLPVMSFELFRRVATDAITMLDKPGPPEDGLAVVDRDRDQ